MRKKPTKITIEQRGELLRLYLARRLVEAQALALSLGVCRYYPTILAARERAKQQPVRPFR